MKKVDLIQAQEKEDVIHQYHIKLKRNLFLKKEISDKTDKIEII